MSRERSRFEGLFIGAPPSEEEQRRRGLLVDPADAMPAVNPSDFVDATRPVDPFGGFDIEEPSNGFLGDPIAPAPAADPSTAPPAVQGPARQADQTDRAAPEPMLGKPLVDRSNIRPVPTVPVPTPPTTPAPPPAAPQPAPLVDRRNIRPVPTVQVPTPTESTPVSDFFAGLQRGAASATTETGKAFATAGRLAAGTAEAGTYTAPTAGAPDKFADLSFTEKLSEPEWWGEFLGSLPPGSAPFLAGAAAGGVSGMKAGAAVGAAGGVFGIAAGGTIGGILGAMVGGGLSAGAQSVGGEYEAARMAGKNHKEAVDIALKAGLASAGINAASLPAGLINPLRGALTNAVAKAAVQSAIGVADQAAANQIAQKYDPNRAWDEGLAEAALGELVFEGPGTIKIAAEVVKQNRQNQLGDSDITPEEIGELRQRVNVWHGQDPKRVDKIMRRATGKRANFDAAMSEFAPTQTAPKPDEVIVDRGLENEPPLGDRRQVGDSVRQQEPLAPPPPTVRAEEEELNTRRQFGPPAPPMGETLKSEDPNLAPQLERLQRAGLDADAVARLDPDTRNQYNQVVELYEDGSMDYFGAAEAFFKKTGVFHDPRTGRFNQGGPDTVPPAPAPPEPGPQRPRLPDQLDRTRNVGPPAPELGEIEAPAPPATPPADEDADVLAQARQALDGQKQTVDTGLAKRLKVSRARAGRILDQLEAEGVVGPKDERNVRPVLQPDAPAPPPAPAEAPAPEPHSAPEPAPRTEESAVEGIEGAKELESVSEPVAVENEIPTPDESEAAAERHSPIDVGSASETQRALLRSLGHADGEGRAGDKLDALRKTGATDAQIREVLSEKYGLGGGQSGIDGGQPFAYRGGESPRFVYGERTWHGKPTLSGKKLIDEVRALVGIPEPTEQAEAPKAGPAAGGERYWKGDKVRYTGRYQADGGDPLYEVEILEGHLKGDRKFLYDPPSGERGGPVPEGMEQIGVEAEPPAPTPEPAPAAAVSDLPQPPAGAEGVQVSRNEDKNGLEVRFPSAPPLEVRKALSKGKMFRFSKRLNLWYAKDTADARQRLSEAFGQYGAPAEAPAEAPAPPTSTAPPGKTAKQAGKLREVAGKIREKAQGAIDQGRLENTPKRAREAAQAKGNARRDLERAQTLENIAAAIEAGEVEHLAGLTSRTQLDVLEGALRRGKGRTFHKKKEGYAENEARDYNEDDIENTSFYPHVYGGVLHSEAREQQDTKGLKQAAARLMKLAERKGTDSYFEISDPKDLEALEKISKGAGKSSRIKEELAEYNRLKRMGIDSHDKLKAALRELIPQRGERITEDPAAAAERALVGQKIPGFFPTPQPIIDQMLENAEIEAGDVVLEPSAGKGDIVKSVKTAHPDNQVDAYEVSSQLRTILEGQGVNLVGRDFMGEDTGKRYDKILMNPPFEKGQDMEHVRAAFDRLNPGGRLVSIVSEGPFFRQDAQSTEFREWLEENEAAVIELPEGAFKSGFRPTGVKTRMIVVEKLYGDDDGNPAGVESDGPVEAEEPAGDEGPLSDAERARLRELGGRDPERLVGADRTEFERLMRREDAEWEQEQAEAKAQRAEEKAAQSERAAKTDDLPFAVSLDDIPERVAYDAHRGTSMVPDERARSEREGYVHHMRQVYEKLAPYATTAEDKAALAAEMERYRDNYLKHQLGVLASRSRVMSAMVTGPAKFPTARNQKRIDAADNKMRAFFEWQEKAQAAMMKRFNPPEKTAISSDEADAPQQLQEKIDKAKAEQERMKAANKIVRSKKLSEAEKIEQLRTALGEDGQPVREETARAVLEPDDMGNGAGFPQYMLQNNLANIKRMEGRLGEIGRRRSEEDREVEFKGGRLVDNVEANRVQIIHDEKPDAEVRAALKKRGFRWSRREGAWQRQRGPNAWDAAKQLLGIKEDAAPAESAEAPAGLREEEVQTGADSPSPSSIPPRRKPASPTQSVGQVIGRMGGLSPAEVARIIGNTGTLEPSTRMALGKLQRPHGSTIEELLGQGERDSEAAAVLQHAGVKTPKDLYEYLRRGRQGEQHPVSLEASAEETMIGRELGFDPTFEGFVARIPAIEDAAGLALERDRAESAEIAEDLTPDEAKDIYGRLDERAQALRDTPGFSDETATFPGMEGRQVPNTPLPGGAAGQEAGTPLFDAEGRVRADAERTQAGQADIFDDSDIPFDRKAPGSGRHASAGGPAQPREKKEGTAGGAFERRLRAVPIPEMVQIARELMGGKLPAVKRLRSAWGAFAQKKELPETQQILIDPDTAADETQLAHTLAHEIGHLVDAMPEARLDRGNLLGRIASLHGYLKEYMAGREGGPDPLTDKERARLRREAEKLLTSDAEIVIDEEIEKTVGVDVTPADILAIWNSASDEIRAKNPGLYDFIAGLSTAEKKSIVKEAMRDQVPAELKRFVGVVREKTGKQIRQKIRSTPSAAEIHRKYQELIEEEARKRQLLSNEKIRKELIALSEWWTPYNKRGASPAYIKYRESSVELYAQAMSVFFNTPGELEQRAPEFYRGLMAYAGRKPEFRKAYLDVQDILEAGDPGLGAARRENIEKMFSEGDQKIRAAIQAKRDAELSVWSNVKNLLGQYVLNQFQPITTRAQQHERLANRAGLSAESASHARHILDELGYMDNPNHVMLEKTEEEVYRPLRDAGVGRDDIGEYLVMRRVVTERGQIANPLGFTPSSASKQLEDMRRRLGDERMDLLQNRVQRWHDLIFDSAERAVESGVYSRAQFENVIEPNRENYATFAVIKHLEDRIGSSIYKSVGTFSEIANPFDATIMKTITLNRLIELNNAKTATLDYLKESFPDEIEAIPLGPSQWEPARPPAKGKGYVTHLVDGKAKAYAVDERVARMFQRHDIGGLARFSRMLNNAVYRVFHPLFVTYNPGFQVANPARDFGRTYTNLKALGSRNRKNLVRALMENSNLSREDAERQAEPQNITLGQVMAAYWSAVPASYRRAKGVHDELISQMYAEKALSTPYVHLDSQDEDAGGQIDRLMEKHGLADVQKDRGAVRQFLGSIGDFVEGVGVFQETLSKVAGYKVLADRQLEGRERAYQVRNHVGTPNFKRGGLLTPLTNSTLMYSRVRWNGLHADWELASDKDSAMAWWGTHVTWTLLPKLAMRAGMAGLFGAAIQEMYEKIPDYYLSDYDVIPIGTVDDEEDGDEKVAFLTLPNDDHGRFFSNLIWRMTEAGGNAAGLDLSPREYSDALSDMLAEGAGEIMPSLNPVLDLGRAWWQYGEGINPHDTFRGRPIVSNTAWSAGGWESAKPMLWWTANKFGVASNAIRPALGRSLYDQTWVEVGASAPPGLSRLLRVSDRGLDEREWAELSMQSRADDQLRLQLSTTVRRMASEHYRFQRLHSKGRLDAERRGDFDRLHTWYTSTYLPLVQAIRIHTEEGDEAGAKRLRETLETASRAKDISQPGRDYRAEDLKPAQQRRDTRRALDGDVTGTDAYSTLVNLTAQARRLHRQRRTAEARQIEAQVRQLIESNGGRGKILGKRTPAAFSKAVQKAAG